MVHRDGNRQKRVGEVLQRALAGIISREVHDPRVGEVTVTGVDVSPDLKNARVFVTLWERVVDQVSPASAQEQQQAGREKQEVVAALNQASGFLRHCLRDEVDLRGIPRLVFAYDESVERGNRIEALLASARHRDSGPKQE